MAMAIKSNWMEFAGENKQSYLLNLALVEQIYRDVFTCKLKAHMVNGDVLVIGEWESISAMDMAYERLVFELGARDDDEAA